MQVEAYLAAREELGPNGFYCWGALMRIDGAITWTSADCIGRGPRFSVAQAQYVAAIEILKRLRALQKQTPQASISMYADSQMLVEELTGTWKQSQRATSAALDEAITLLRTLEPIVLRYCSRSANLEAHALITQLCLRYGVAVKARFVREGR